MRHLPRPISRRVATALFVLGVLAVAPVPARAHLSCSAAVTRTSVPRGENIVLTVSAVGDIGWSADFRLPTMEGIRVQSGGTNQSMSMVNGKTRTSVSRVWYLTVDRADDFTIQPVVISVAGQVCKTEPVKIKVTAALPPKAIPPSTTGNRVPSTGGPDVRIEDIRSGEPGDDIFVTLEADHKEAWVGQQIILTFRYWRRIQPWNNPSYKAPRTEGFWREDLGAEKNYRKVVQGRAYNVTEIRYSLFPTRVGELTIESAELSFPEGVFDRFFNSRRARRGPNVLKTQSLVVNVRELPEPRPEGFSGIVASRLSLVAAVDQDSIPRGEALGLKVTLVADGFLKGFSGLDIPAVEGARMHDASESFESRPTHDRMSGSITMEKVLIPGRDGELKIPPVVLSWFDSRLGEYRTARAAVRTIQVMPSDLPLDGDDSSGFLRSEISRLSDDLAFIHPVPSGLGRRNGPLVSSAFWWFLLLLPVLLLGLLRFYLVRLSADRRNPAARRLRMSLATASAELENARESDSTTGCMAGLARSIEGFVADCTGRPAAAVGAADIREYCDLIGRPDDGLRLAAILDECDSSRFGGVQGAEGGLLVDEVAKLLKVLDEARKARTKAGEASSAPVAGLLSVMVLSAFAWTILAGSPVLAQDHGSDQRPGADPTRLMAEGNQAYTEGKIPEALGLYLQAQDLGVNDPALHFNLGNAYARRGELGQAVASYLRARRLDPGDRDVQTNLAWVRQHIKDLELSDNELPLFIAQAAGVVSALTLDQWGLVLVVLTWFAAAMVGWGWYREDFGIQLRRSLLGVLGCVLVVAAITAGRWYNEEVRDEAVVIVEMAEVKSGPADNFSVLFQVHDGLTVNIEGEREGWVRIGLGGEWVGWLPAGSVTPVRLPADSF